MAINYTSWDGIPSNYQNSYTSYPSNYQNNYQNNNNMVNYSDLSSTSQGRPGNVSRVSRAAILRRLAMGQPTDPSQTTNTSRQTSRQGF